MMVYAWMRICLFILIVGMIKTACSDADVYEQDSFSDDFEQEESSNDYEYEFIYHLINTAIVPYEDITIIRTIEELEVFKKTRFDWLPPWFVLSLADGDAPEL